MGTRTWRYPRGGWRDTDVWLDPAEVTWFGELARTVQAAPAVPLLAGADWGAIALPGPGLPTHVARAPRRRPGQSPSRARRLATRLFPTVASLAAVAAAAPLFLASRAAEPLVASPAAAAAQDVRAPASFADAPLPASTAPAPTATPAPAAVAPEEPAVPAIDWRTSEAVGVPHAGRLVDGVRLPLEGPGWVTWDPVLEKVPNRANRLYGTDTLVRVVLDVIAGYRAAHPGAPPVLIGDLSLRAGGDIDDHVSHENGRDVDVYYPRLDGLSRPPTAVDQIDLPLAQDLVDRFVAAGVDVIFVGGSTPLYGPSGVVVPYPQHDNHMHVRIAAPTSR